MFARTHGHTHAPQTCARTRTHAHIPHKHTHAHTVTHTHTHTHNHLRGRFGVVYKGCIVSSNEPCAIKVLSKRANKKADVNKEVTLMKSLKHPSIIAFIDFYESQDQFVLITEL